MTKQKDDLWDILGAIGFEDFFEGNYNDLKPNSIERAMWREIAIKIIDKYKEMGGK